MRAGLFILTILIFIGITSCELDYYNKSVGFDDQTWVYDSPVSFYFVIKDTALVYDMVLTVDHSDIYPYQNLYLQTETTFPSDTTVSQTLSLELANAAGFWFGDCSGSNCSIAIPIQSKVHFTEAGEYAVSFEQFTRTDSLPGLSSLKLQLFNTRK